MTPAPQEAFLGTWPCHPPDSPQHRYVQNRFGLSRRPKMEGRAAHRTVVFYPVVHLLTGPPGLRRNGGIWKIVKNRLAQISKPSRLMVQAFHFSMYSLSASAWDDWFAQVDGSTRLAQE